MCNSLRIVTTRARTGVLAIDSQAPYHLSSVWSIHWYCTCVFAVYILTVLCVWGGHWQCKKHEGSLGILHSMTMSGMSGMSDHVRNVRFETGHVNAWYCPESVRSCPENVRSCPENVRSCPENVWYCCPILSGKGVRNVR